MSHESRGSCYNVVIKDPVILVKEISIIGIVFSFMFSQSIAINKKIDITKDLLL